MQNQLEHCLDPQDRQILQQTLNKILAQEEMLQSKGALPDNERLICDGDGKDSDDETSRQRSVPPHPEPCRLLAHDGLLLRPPSGSEPYGSRAPSGPMLHVRAPQLPAIGNNF